MVTELDIGATSDSRGDRIRQFMADLTAQDIEYVRFELPDLHGVARSKVVPIDKVESYTLLG